MEKMRQWTILAALGVVGVLAAGWFLLVSPQRAHASDLRAKAATAQQATAGLRSQVAQLKQQQKGEPAQQRRLMQIAAQIPDNPQLPTLIRELSAAAHASGVSLVSLSPSQPAAVASATTATGAVGTCSARADPGRDHRDRLVLQHRELLPLGGAPRPRAHGHRLHAHAVERSLRQRLGQCSQLGTGRGRWSGSGGRVRVPAGGGDDDHTADRGSVDPDPVLSSGAVRHRGKLGAGRHD
jgi:hypothetical protein